jgi:hypothetical protein
MTLTITSTVVLASIAVWLVSSCATEPSDTIEESQTTDVGCQVAREEPSTVESGELPVPGAVLYYEIRGAGPRRG